jgi:dTDP-4-dehydrorhamnose 3,5-epimerase
MKVTETRLPGVLLVEPQVYADERGFFLETWQGDRYAAAGLPFHFVQDNLSFSLHGVLRGLHSQYPLPQGKLVTVLQGSVFDVVVDVRVGSPTFGEWVGVELSAGNRRQLYVPEGFAHGFQVTGDEALFLYKCTAPYAPEHEVSIRWDDPELAISWPVYPPVLSRKDGAAPLLRDVPAERLLRYEAEGAR